MMRSLFSGVSGLKTHQTKMDVIGNNISNVNTVAFKSSSTTFSDIMYQTTSQASGATATRGGTNAKQIGLGVTNGATKISITSSGAAQSTGDALDIRLTDTNTTNFFVVKNGDETMYTRAGSFYIDGQGNLAMTTTGYLVQGVMVKVVNGKNTGELNAMPDNTADLTGLKVMSEEFTTAAPEATTLATMSGVIDKNDTNVTSTTGYVRSLTFYDNEGYTYTAKFSIKRIDDGKKGQYTIELTNVYDKDNKDILATYLSEDDTRSISDIFGVDGTAPYTTSELASGYSVETYTIDKDADTTASYLTYTDPTTKEVYVCCDSTLKTDSSDALNPTADDFTDADNPEIKTLTFYKVKSEDGENLDIDTASSITKSQAEVFGISTDDQSDLSDVTLALDGSTLTLSATVETENYGIQFDTSDGSFDSLMTGYFTTNAGSTAVLKASALGINEDNPAMQNITIDFSGLLNYENGGTSTVTAERGDADGTGAGKAMGTMSGLSVSSDGKIYGSYTNGNTILLGQIAVAQFANASGLEELGDNCYGTTLNSGDAQVKDVSEDGSSMSTGQLEMSNVDLSSEFTNMIITQRGFQANSRIITVSDTLLEELINLKR